MTNVKREVEETAHKIAREVQNPEELYEAMWKWASNFTAVHLFEVNDLK